MIALILTVLTCSGGHLTVDQCPTEQLAVYDVKVWMGPTEDDMNDCVSNAESLIGNGERAKCEIVDAERASPASLDDSSAYRPTLQTLAF